MKSHIQCLIWVSISSIQELEYLPVFVSIKEVRKGRVFWTTNSIPSICHAFHREPTTYWNIWHSSLKAIEELEIPLDFWTVKKVTGFRKFNAIPYLTSTSKILVSAQQTMYCFMSIIHFNLPTWEPKNLTDVHYIVNSRRRQD